ncbi:uncharacterized protein [Nicotiana tomentosiformis]|uniref:uncharacterized protein n=1 Tax=Nicotiana tomentosiformis TaxID=4098 RepID=UPI00388CCB1B
MLREFVSRFQMKRMELPPVTDDWDVQAFTQGLNDQSSVASRQLKQNLIEYPAVTWADVHNRYQLKIRVEDDQLGTPSGSAYPIRPVGRTQRDIDREPRSNRNRYQPYNTDRRNNGSGRNPIRNDRRNDRGQSSRGNMRKNGFDKCVDTTETPRLSEYNFSIDVSGIVSAIGRIKDTRWPRPLQTDSSQRNPNQICKYHGTHGHRTKDCRQLREEVARLFNEGHLREFLSDGAKNHFRDRDADRKNEHEDPQHVIHMIVGGIYIPQGPVFKRTKVKRVLIDPGSSANIIRSWVVEQLSLQDQIVPAARVLNGFNMASETTKGEIILLVNIAGTIQETKFHLIEGDMRYNALFERPWIHNMRAVPSTLYQMLKFPIPDGVKIVYGEQHAAKEMFAVDEVIPVSALLSTK